METMAPAASFDGQVVVSIVMNILLFYNGKSIKMDMNWGYPYFRKPLNGWLLDTIKKTTFPFYPTLTLTQV